jgi:integrase
MELALLLAESTGRRLGAIRQLRWEDFDFANGKVKWRADADKTGRDWTVPLPAELLDEIKRFRVKLGGAFGGYVFPSRADPEKALDRHAFQKALVAAEKHAGLPKLDGSSWHAYRRSWASSRKNLPLADVAFAGGWNGARTLLGIYQQPDMATMLTVMSSEQKIRDSAVGT